MRASLTIEAGQGSPVAWELEADRPTTLGRNSNNTIVLDDEHASRLHAELCFEAGSWVIRDCNTVNGTWLNGQRIQKAVLAHDQVIGIGLSRLRFQLTDATLPVPSPRRWPGSGTRADPDTTLLATDELTALYQFTADSVHETESLGLIRLALETVQRQMRAAFVGFLSLDEREPLPRLVQPAGGPIDYQLSRWLTRVVQEQGRRVWLAEQQGQAPESESLLIVRDAVCVPLRSGDAAFGALHAYTGNDPFSERSVRFCEVLAGHLASCLRLVRERRSREAEITRLRTQTSAAGQLLGDSAVMRQLRHAVAKAATSAAVVLIQGESGSGKELVAEALHRHSDRQDGPFVAINCSAIASSLIESELFGHCKGAFTNAYADRPGLFQQADEGTLFLDEVGELSPECQAKLLRVLEGKGFRPVGATEDVRPDVRVVAATNRDLDKEAAAGKFRRDLLYRLQGIPLRVPPLREHLEDVPTLAEDFLAKRAVKTGRRAVLSPAALQQLCAYSWPGNVRQLFAALESAAAMHNGPAIEPADLPILPDHPTDGPPTLNLEELEAWAVRQALKRTKGNIAQAAKLLGVVRDTVRNLMERYGIDKVEGRAE